MRRGAKRSVKDDDWTPLEQIVSKDIFKAEVAAWTRRIRVEPKEVHLRPMTRKWGSCSTAGRVTFNDELLSHPATFRKRVIVEELAPPESSESRQVVQGVAEGVFGNGEGGGGGGTESGAVSRDSRWHRHCQTRSDTITTLLTR